MISDFIDGFLIECALIMTVGLQNAFILKQGIKKEHVFIAALVCACSETLLVSIGIAGIGAIISAVPILLNFITFCGVLFLIYYAIKSLYAAIKLDMKIDVSGDIKLRNIKAVMASALAFSLLNPHVVLDTTLMGALSAKFIPHQWIFGAGVISAAFVWFAVLASLGRILAKPLNNTKTWRIINIIVAALCVYMAFNFAMILKNGGEHSHEHEGIGIIEHIESHK